MREHQTQQSTDVDTERMAESTMNQSRQAMEQLIDLQRNMARMTLNALEWQETAQRQGLEMTKSMLESAPGPQFTESMMQSYLQGIEAVMPEMEQVMERGMQAAAQPQTARMEQMGDRMQGMGPQNQMPGQGRTTEHGMGQRGTSGGQQMGGQQTGSRQPGGQQTGSQQPGSPGRSQQGMGRQGMTGQRTEQQRTGGEMRSQRRMDRQPQMQTQARMGGQQGQSDRSQSQGYPQTGEWVTPQEYGGESTSASGSLQQPMTAAPTHSSGDESGQFGGQSQGGGPDRSQRRSEEGQISGRGQFEQGDRQSQSQGPQSRTGAQRGPEQHGSQPRGSDRTRRGREYDQPTQHQQSFPERTEQGRLRDQYSQRIDTDRREGGERGRQRRGEQSAVGGRHGQGSEADTGRDEATRSPERRAMEETDVTSEQPQRSTEESHGTEERGSNQK